MAERLLLYGDSPSWKHFQVQELRNRLKIAPRRFDFLLQQDELDLELSVQSLFSEPRLVVVENCDSLFEKGHSGLDVDYLLSIDDEDLNLVLITEKKPKSNLKSVKKLEKQFTFVACNTPDQNGIRQFIDKQLKNHGIFLGYPEKNWLYEHLGSDPYMIHNEIDKLAVFSKRPVLDEIVALCSENAEESVFKLCNAFFERDASSFYRLYTRFRKENMEVQAILALLASQIRTILNVKILVNKRMAPQQIEKELKLSKYRLKHCLRNASRFTAGELLGHLSELAKIDQAFKNGKMDRDEAVQLYILRNFSKKHP